MRLGVRQLGIGGGLLLLVSLAALVVTLWTPAGLRLALALVPKDLGFSVAAMEGSLAGGFRLEGVTLAEPDLAADRLEGRLRARALLAGELAIEALRVSGLRVLAGARNREGAGEPWPFPLAEPALRVPVPVRLAVVECVGDGIVGPFALSGTLALGREGLRLEALALRLPDLAVELGGRAGGERFAVDLDASLSGRLLPAPLSVRLRGDLRHLKLDAEAVEGAPLAIRFRGAGLGEAEPTVALSLAAAGLDPRFAVPDWPHGPLDLDLRIDLAGKSLGLRGSGKAGETPFTVAGEGRFGEGELVIGSLAVDLPAQLSLAAAGTLAGDGKASLSGTLALRVPPPVAAALAGEFRLSGRLAALDFAWTGDLRAADETSAFLLAGRAEPDRIEVHTLRLSHRAGGLELAGALELAPVPGGALRGRIDRLLLPALGLPLSGWVSARIEAEARLDRAPSVLARIESLSGELAGERLSGRLEADWRGSGGGAKADLALGSGRLRARLRAQDGRFEGRAEARGLALPGVFGPLDAEAELSGLWPSPAWALRLRLAQGEAGGLALRELSLEARGMGAAIEQASLRAGEIGLEGRALGQLEAGLAGGAEYELALALSGTAGRLAAQVSGRRDGASWQGRVGRLDIERGGFRLALAAPAAFAVERTGWGRLTRLCLEGSGRLCLEAQRAARGLEAILRVDGLPVEALSAELPPPWSELAGPLAAEVEFAPGPSAQLSMRFSPSRWPGEGTPPLETISLAAELSPERVQVRGELDPAGRFSLRADRASGEWLGEAGGEVELGPLEPWIPEVAGLAGRLRAAIAREQESGVRLFLAADGLAFELPSLGTALAFSSLEAKGRPEALAIAGEGRIGEGTLRLAGLADLAEGTIALSLQGSELALIERPDLRLVASPRLSIELAPAGGRLEGRVSIPRGRIDLSRLEAAEPHSRDVVLVGEELGTRWPLSADLLLEVGQEVALRGFGLDARLSGVVHLRERSGQPTAAFGALQVEGRFSAYGTELDIARGRIIFAGPLDSPLLDVRAERAMEGGRRVAIEARGEARAPELRLAAEPALAEEEILAYLVTGRSLSELRSGEGATLAQAAAVLGTLGGDLLARRLGDRLGLSLALGQDASGAATLTAGRQLSPRLFMGYGFALDGGGQHLLLRYLLGRRWRAEVESGATLRARLEYQGERREP